LAGDLFRGRPARGAGAKSRRRRAPDPPRVRGQLANGFSFTSGARRLRFNGYQRPYDLENAIQEIFLRTKKTIILVTHDPREAACLGDRVLVFSGRPGRIKADIKIDLPRPRDINSIELAQQASLVAQPSDLLAQRVRLTRALLACPASLTGSSM
jgi:hypothetical protein